MNKAISKMEKITTANSTDRNYYDLLTIYNYRYLLQKKKESNELMQTLLSNMDNGERDIELSLNTLSDEYL